MILNTLRWLVRQVGLSDGRILDPAFNGRTPDVQRPMHLPAGQARLHLFAATFEDRGAAKSFCYGSGDINTPEPITQELDGATINTDFLEIAQGDIHARLIEFLSEEDTQKIMADLRKDNTIIILTEEAFSGLPFQVHDTNTLRYPGDRIVLV
jgi:hypothetical protein